VLYKKQEEIRVPVVTNTLFIHFLIKRNKFTIFEIEIVASNLSLRGRRCLRQQNCCFNLNFSRPSAALPNGNFSQIFLEKKLN
jgi:hypothetical protein